jgi:hypothetical protein
LSKAGFANPQDKIDQQEAFSGSADSISNLKEAAAAVEAQKIVILGVHAEWIEMLRTLKAYYAKTWPELGRGSGKKWEELNMGGPIKGEPFVKEEAWASKTSLDTSHLSETDRHT